MTAPPRPPLDVRRFGELLDRLDAALAAFDASGADLAAAIRRGDPAAMAGAEDAHRVAADGLRAVAAERAALLRECGAASLTRLAADSRLVHLVSRCGSLAGRLAETRRRSRAALLANRRAASACGAVRDLLARGGRRAAALHPRRGRGRRRRGAVRRRRVAPFSPVPFPPAPPSDVADRRVAAGRRGSGGLLDRAVGRGEQTSPTPARRATPANRCGWRRATRTGRAGRSSAGACGPRASGSTSTPSSKAGCTLPTARPAAAGAAADLFAGLERVLNELSDADLSTALSDFAAAVGRVTAEPTNAALRSALGGRGRRAGPRLSDALGPRQRTHRRRRRASRTARGGGERLDRGGRYAQPADRPAGTRRAL